MSVVDIVVPRLAVLAGVMVALAVLEAWLPLRRQDRAWRERGAANLMLTGLFLGMNIALTVAVAGTAARLEARGFGVLHLLPGWLGFGAAIVALDFFAYVAHWSMHKVPALWRIHRVHHSDEAVDVTTAYRQHPLETLLRFAFTSIPAILLGASATATATYRLVSGVNALLEHANLGLPPRLERWLNLVVVTPPMHKVHHADEARYTDSNYGNILSAFDRLFRTWTPSTASAPVRYGLGLRGTQHRRFSGLLRLPWSPRLAAP